MIRVKELSFGYGEELILKNISFSTEKGQVYALLGPNGSGKSTLLKVMDRLFSPQQGSVWIDQKNLAKFSRKEIAKRIAYLPQETEIPFSFTAFEIVLMGRAHNVGTFFQPKPAENRKALTALQMIGIEHLKNMNYNELSGGQKRLVLISRALAQEARIYLFDEPTNHLDFPSQYKVLELIRRLTKQYSYTSIIAMHDPTLAVFFSDEVIMIKNGAISALGETQKTITEKNLSSLYDFRVHATKINGRIFIYPEGPIEPTGQGNEL